MVTKRPFGSTNDGTQVFEYTITNQNGFSLSALDYGCTITKILMPDRHGMLQDVCLGYDSLAEYEENDAYLGAVCGRTANRIKNAVFTLNNNSYKLYANNNSNHLHGGNRGFDKFVWNAAYNDDSITFSRISPDGEEGYPGNLSVSVSYQLTNDNKLIINYNAQCSTDTIANLTNHAYFNLAGHGFGDVLNHKLRICADKFTETDDMLITTGNILPVHNTPFDFTAEKSIGQDISNDDEQIKLAGGYDHNFVLNPGSSVLYSPDSGIEMTVTTTMPGLQLYTANTLTERTGKNNAKYKKHCAVCLETQFFPNSMQHPHFPSCVLKAGQQYSHSTVYAFGIRL